MEEGQGDRELQGQGQPERSQLPMDFFGNMVPRLQVRDLLGWSYGGVVAAIRDAAACVKAEPPYLWAEMGNAHIHRVIPKIFGYG
jgi:hypothetical protein